MRKILLSVLAATTAATSAAPALAQRATSDDRDTAREERSERAKARQERAQERRASRAEPVQRPERAQQRSAPAQQQSRALPVQRIDRTARRVAVPQQNRVRPSAQDRRAANLNERGRPTLDQRSGVRQRVDRVRPTSPIVQRERQISRDRAVRQAERPRRVAPPPGARPDLQAPPPATTAHVRAPTWNRDWRRDRRHDWRGYRDRNRTHFRIGIYYDPFGWNYRRYNVGWRLWPSYYSSHFWLSDPHMYQLPYAPWPYRWVRYYNDVLLVNTMSGQVVDVIHDFFW
jgi:Ni/Co efflux regulator RcnB